MSAMDTDVLKAYVEIGLGVGIIAAMTFDPKRDQALRLIDAANLFASNTTVIGLRRGALLRTYAYRFIELCSPALSEQKIKAAANVETQLTAGVQKVRAVATHSANSVAKRVSRAS